MKKNPFQSLLLMIWSVCLLLAAADIDLSAQNASETKALKELSYEEKLARWNSFSEEQKEAIRRKARAMSEKKFKQLENNFERIRSFEPAEQERVKQNFGRMKQFLPQQQRVLKRKFERFQQLPVEQKQQFRKKFIPQLPQQPGFRPQYQGQQPGQHQSQQPEQRPGFKPQHQGQQPGQQPGFRPQHQGQQSGQQPGFKPQLQGQQPRQQPGLKPQHQGQQPGRQPGFRPQHQGQQPGQQPDQRYGPHPEHEQGFRPGQQPGFKPQHQRPPSGQHFKPRQRPGFAPGQAPDRPPGLRPDQQQGFRPDHQPGFGPDHRPSDGDMRKFRRDMMGDKDNREGQEPFQKRWRDIDRYREGFGQPGQPDQSGHEQRNPEFPGKMPPPPEGLNQHPHRPHIPENMKPDADIDKSRPLPSEIRRPPNNDKKPMMMPDGENRKPGISGQKPPGVLPSGGPKHRIHGLQPTKKP